MPPGSPGPVAGMATSPVYPLSQTHLLTQKVSLKDLAELQSATEQSLVLPWPVRGFGDHDSCDVFLPAALPLPPLPLQCLS